MVAAKNSGHGAKVSCKFDDISFTLMENVRIITPPPWQRDEVDVTDLEDTAVSTQAADPPDYGEMTFEYFHDPSDTNHDFMDTEFGTGDIHEWKILWPLAAGDYEMTFNGWIKTLSPADLGSKDAIMRTGTIRVTSIPTEV